MSMFLGHRRHLRYWWSIGARQKERDQREKFGGQAWAVIPFFGRETDDSSISSVSRPENKGKSVKCGCETDQAAPSSASQPSKQRKTCWSKYSRGESIRQRPEAKLMDGVRMRISEITLTQTPKHFSLTSGTPFGRTVILGRVREPLLRLLRARTGDNRPTPQTVPKTFVTWRAR